MSPTPLRTAVIALGGNALSPAGERATAANQFRHTRESLASVVDLALEGWNLCIVHGNGPQVGDALLRNEIAGGEVEPLPLGLLVAATAGWIGYMIQQSLGNALRKAGSDRDVVSIITQVEVAQHDPALENPTKPIGSHMEEARAKQLAKKYRWTVREDAGRGWRRVVPSPKPQGILETSVIKTLAAAGYVVVACGGGGIPVIEDEQGDLQGVEAVIDKDLASSLLARSMEADLLVLPTGVEKVALDFNKPTQRWLDRMTLAEARRHLAEDQFDKGSMGPKITALIDFVAGGGHMGLITDAPNLSRALRGDTGTRVVAR